ncbi:uncharacterized protein B0I36DRAFT_8806 [Microdochium trichocladiopsis]|uniref:Uncharacterized protein n=1 Tax=Microdochium trichocladiopsis TaxID=1682393 RepID=A0A9P8YHY0_9PEZI|nr:uncharacterized protein B0I36DRAFT_8806 [Microdochium trichocladiopsis]KAH7040327.1 hypothetical protein B0I36DRAFT_8806 [Microdochium trichocladiopsis]
MSALLGAHRFFFLDRLYCCCIWRLWMLFGLLASEELYGQRSLSARVLRRMYLIALHRPLLPIQVSYDITLISTY